MPIRTAKLAMVKPVRRRQGSLLKSLLIALMVSQIAGMSKKPLLVLVDGSAVFHRGYHAIPHLSNKEGLPTNAVFGFATILLKVLHPLLGTGTASFQLFFNWEEYSGDDSTGWVGNTPLRILHDTGAIGLAVFLAFIGSLLLTARKVVRMSRPKTKSFLIALQAGLLLYAITFQASEASLLAFTGCTLDVWRQQLPS